MKEEQQTQKPDGFLMKYQKQHIASRIGDKSVICNAEINLHIHQIHRRCV
jgi:hypothetical protein